MSNVNSTPKINDIHDDWFTECLALTSLTLRDLKHCRYSYDGYVYIVDALTGAGLRSPSNAWKVIKRNVQDSITVFTHPYGDCCSFRDLIHIFVGCFTPEFNNLRTIMATMFMDGNKSMEPWRQNARLITVIKTLKKYGNDHMKEICDLKEKLKCYEQKHDL
jgi:hypothetical protein